MVKGGGLSSVYGREFAHGGPATVTSIGVI